jgi:3-methylcrotonyl-CoA carboxylase alpha subunit
MTDKIVTIGSDQTEVELERDGTTFRSGAQAVEVVSMGAEELEARVDGRHFVIPYSIQGTSISFSFDGEIYFADVADKGARARARHRDHSTSAPMPGMVLKILVRPGDVVAKGAPLLILEAMKMEHQIVAPRDGTISTINCAEGELVQPGVELVSLNDER